MTSEKIISTLTRIETLIKEKDFYSVFDIIEKERAAAEAEIRSQKAKTGGKKSIYSAACRILKNAPATMECLRYAYKNNGFITVCDSFCAVQINENNAPELPELPSEKTYVNIDRIVDGAADACDEPVTLPDVQSLKAFIKIEKAKQKCEKIKTPLIYELKTRNFSVFVNAEFLLNVIECLPGATARAAKPLAALFFESENGRGVLLPARPQKYRT